MTEETGIFSSPAAHSTARRMSHTCMEATVRPIQEATGKKLDSHYFCQTILPDYLRANPEQTAGWDVVFDARGRFTEPHTSIIVPLGTVEDAVRVHHAGSC